MNYFKYLITMITLRTCWANAVNPIHKNLNYEQLKVSFPSHIRKIQLYSRQGFFLAIYENGTVGSTTERSSPDAILEMESFSVNVKRIRKPNTFYLAINKVGRIRTRTRQRADTFFIEHHNGNYLCYENLATQFILAMKRNGDPKDQVTKTSKHKKKTHFLIMNVPS